MTQQTQSFFSQNDRLKQAASYPRQKRNADEKPLTIIVGSRTNGGSIKYFDLMTEKFDSDSSDRAKSEKENREVFGVGRNAKIAGAALRNSPPRRIAAAPLPLFSAATDAQETFDMMLEYLDRILRLDEMRENLEKLDAARATGDIDKVGSIARDCLGINIGCGIRAAAEPLHCLSVVDKNFRLADAEILIERIKVEYERFRLNVKKNLEQNKTAND